MSGLVLVAVLCIFAGLVHAQDNAQWVSDIPKGGFFKQPGDELRIKCQLDTGANFLIQKQLRFVRKSAKTGNETTISEQGSVMADLKDFDNYDLSFEITPKITAELLVKVINDDMDGQFMCQVKDNAEKTLIQESVSVNVTVAGGVQKLEMEVGKNEMVSTNENIPLEFREGKIKVECTASGTNPQPLIHLYLGDEQLPIKDMVTIEDKDSRLTRRSFKGSVKYVIDFKTSMFGKKLKCHAETEIPKEHESTTIKLDDRTVSALLKGVTDDPRVQCTNNTAGVNDRQVTLKCMVSKEPKMKEYFFRIRDQLLYPGNKTKSHTEVYAEMFNATHTSYVLKFYQMEKWHFKEDIYFEIKAYDDKTYQYIVYLIKGPDMTTLDPIGAAATLTATIVVPVVLLAVLRALI